MKFKLNATGSFYDDKEKKKLEKLGFKFKLTAEVYKDDKWEHLEKWYKDFDDLEIEIKDLKELMEFVKEWGEIVLNEDSIEIYNDYRE